MRPTYQPLYDAIDVLDAALLRQRLLIEQSNVMLREADARRARSRRPSLMPHQRAQERPKSPG
ncbi:MAG TPA: hypothetical protein VFH48_12065 [Chloroflexota bacterium]|nr:hypothetical protein [Chloroflexota bacterium]